MFGTVTTLPSTLAFLVFAGEFLGGIGLIVGLFSRIAAMVISVTMLGAIVTVHFRFGLFLKWFGNQKGHGIEYRLLAIALALVVVIKGRGSIRGRPYCMRACLSRRTARRQQQTMIMAAKRAQSQVLKVLK